jgi:hypothetical protein
VPRSTARRRLDRSALIRAHFSVDRLRQQRRLVKTLGVSRSNERRVTHVTACSNSSASAPTLSKRPSAYVACTWSRRPRAAYQNASRASDATREWRTCVLGKCDRLRRATLRPWPTRRDGLRSDPMGGDLSIVDAFVSIFDAIYVAITSTTFPRNIRCPRLASDAPEPRAPACSVVQLGAGDEGRLRASARKGSDKCLVWPPPNS